MLNRRQFLKLFAYTTTAITMSESIFAALAEAFMGKAKPPLVWLEATTCSGNILSTLNSLAPNFQELMQNTFNFVYSNTLMSAEGDLAYQVLERVPREYPGQYLLVVDGSISTKRNGLYTIIGHHQDGTPITALEQVRKLAEQAKYIVAAGTCASFGGPFSAHPNPAGVQPLHRVITQPVINVPGCPVHPDWMIGTLAHLLLYGVPSLDAYHRPTMFYQHLIHDRCPRRTLFENGVFADQPGEDGCYYKLGCKGPVTYADCPTRQWITLHNNWPVEANSPCIGCASPGFPEVMMPYFERVPDVQVPFGRTNVEKVVKFGTLTAGLGLAGHFTFSILSGRIGSQLIEGTKNQSSTQKARTVKFLRRPAIPAVRREIIKLVNKQEAENGQEDHD